MQKVLWILIVIQLAQHSFCALGVDVSQLFSHENYTCMKNSGISFAVVRGYCSFGGIDTHAVQSLRNVQSAGLATDIYMFPCRGKNATAQVDQMIAGIPGNLYKTVWVDVETNPSAGCSWSGHDEASNCAFLAELAKRITEKGKPFGFYASRYMWGSIFGSYTACQQFGSYELWYPHYDSNPSFSDFQSFGGWTKPKMKQYAGTSALCGASVDRNFLP